MATQKTASLEPSNTNTVIIDTQCANLASVCFALQRIGDNPTISADPSVLANARRLILPGVGSAQAAMDQLNRIGLKECIKTLTQPVLGICLGMQLLAKSSEEGQCHTLNIIDGTVRHLKKTPTTRLPHMGWNRIYFSEPHPLLSNIEQGSYFYFIHSYAYPTSQHTLATCKYNESFSAIVQKDNFIGVQFHPERSGKTGEQLLRNFITLSM